MLAGVSKPVVARAFSAFERHGLAKRGRDPNDRRLTPLHLQPKGQSLMYAINAALASTDAIRV